MDITHHEDDGVVLGITKNDEIRTYNGAEHIINMAPTRNRKRSMLCSSNSLDMAFISYCK